MANQLWPGRRCHVIQTWRPTPAGGGELSKKEEWRVGQPVQKWSTPFLPLAAPYTQIHRILPSAHPPPNPRTYLLLFNQRVLTKLAPGVPVQPDVVFGMQGQGLRGDVCLLRFCGDPTWAFNNRIKGQVQPATRWPLNSYCSKVPWHQLGPR